MEGKFIMKRICRLADKSNRTNIDLRDYEKLIIDTINEVAPGKNPVVTKNHFTSDLMTRGQVIRLGLALSAIPDLAVLGKTITTFRLFDGRIVEDTPKVASKAMTKDKQNRTDDQKEDKTYGGHHRKEIPHDRRSTESVLTNQ